MEICNLKRGLHHWSAARRIALGFAIAILIGSLLLKLPCCLRPQVQIRYIDALYTSASAVCVTGLTVADSGDCFSPLGQFILAALIQLGGLGLSCVGAGVILAMGGRLDLKDRNLVCAASNLDSGQSVIRFVKGVLAATLTIEGIGAALALPIFARDYPPMKAVGMSLFHSIAAFNNSGFDLLGARQSMQIYRNHLYMNLLTCALIFLGGVGFPVIHEMRAYKLRRKRYSLHAKAVLSTSGALILLGALLLKRTEDTTWLGAFFQSVSARTAGFSTDSISAYSSAGKLTLMVLMFIGASPASTGGGIKTSAFFALVQGVRASSARRSARAFHYALPESAFCKAATIAFLALAMICAGTWLFLILEPAIPLENALFEIVSAFSTAGLSTGITPDLHIGAKLLCICMMFLGRIGPMSAAAIWHLDRIERVHFPEGRIAIG